VDRRGKQKVSSRCQDHGLSEARQIYLAAANPTVSREELLSLSARGPLPLAEDQNEMACALHVKSYQRTTRWRGCEGGEAMSDCLIQVAITKWEGASFWTSAGRGCDWPGFRQAQYPVSWERDGSTVHIASMLLLPNSSWISPMPSMHKSLGHARGRARRAQSPRAGNGSGFPRSFSTVYGGSTSHIGMPIPPLEERL
jgi:hypothetical protein